MSGLDDEQRRLILLEEQYREEVRRQLSEQAPAGGRARALKFFNTNLGLWLLSAVFISGLGTVYRCYEGDREYTRAADDRKFQERQLRLEKALEAKAVRDAAVARLDREISYRFSRALTKLRDMALLFRVREAGKTGKSLDALSQQHHRDAEAAIEQLVFAPSDPRDVLYRENEQKSVASLLLELATSIEAAAEQAAIQKVHQTLVARAESPVRLMAFGAPHARDEAAWLHENCILPRWRTQGFVYTTCTPQTPFCGSNVSASSKATATVR